jgi:tetratricopeptide (TPR) repeat protein
MKEAFGLSFVVAAFILSAAFRFAIGNTPKARPANDWKTLTARKREFSLSCRVPPAFVEQPPDIPPLTGWGSHRWKISTGSDSTQFYFNQGINLYYAFHTLEARASFAKAIRFDSSCAMAYFGKALALGPTINFGNGFRAKCAAFEAAQTSKKLQTPCTPLEKGLISAIGKRYSADTTHDLKKLQTDYSESMRFLADAFPKNADVITLYADALMLEHPWDLYDAALRPKPWTPEIRSVLRKAMAIDSLHPGALHYMIHAVEGSLHPEDGVGSAELLAGLMPDVAHAVHMPSHIYIRSGNYKKGIEVNDEAIRSYDKYRTLYQPVEEGAALYLLHAVHMKSACAMMAGNFSIAISASDTIRRLVPKSELLTHDGFGNFLQYSYDFRLFTLLRFGAWDQILLDSVPDPLVRYSVVLHHFARGMAFSHLSRYAEAERELGRLRAGLQDAELKASYDPFSNAYEAGQVAEAILTGVLAGQKGQYRAAKMAFEKAVKAEDALIYDEPRDWPLPARQYLGDLLLKTGDPAGAIAVFERDLEINPMNGWSLTGLKQAYGALNSKASLQKVNMDLTIAWQIKDREIPRAVY